MQKPNVSRIVIMFLLLVSLAFNYIIWKDNQWLQFRHELMVRHYTEDVVGYDYCSVDNNE